MSRRKQPSQPEVNPDAFQAFLNESGVNVAGEPIQLDAPTPEDFWADGETAFDSALPGMSPIQVAQEAVDAALAHQAAGETVYDLAASRCTPLPTAVVTVTTPIGYPLNQALAKSPYLRLAARKLNHTPVIVVSNGWKYWTADLNSFEPVLAPFEPDAQIGHEDWQPVYGDDRGLYMGARK